MKETKYQIKDAQNRCAACFAYFVLGANSDNVYRYTTHTTRSGAWSAMHRWWPDFDFTGYATMRRHGVRPWTQVRDEDGDKIKKWHIEDGFGSEVISERLGISKGQCLQVLRSFDWYDPNRAKSHLSVRKLGTKRKDGARRKGLKPEWQLHRDKIERERRSKRTRAINDLPLFDFAVKERERERYYNTPRTDSDRKREMERYRNDERFWLKNNLRKRLNKFVSKTQKVHGFENYAGCTVDELREWLELQFEPWMNWGNKGKWHVDHIVPCAKFDLTDKAQQVACFNWRNLQPLSGRANISKGDSISESVIHIKAHPRQDIMGELVEIVSPFVNLPL